jgi:hypothetical protein
MALRKQIFQFYEFSGGVGSARNASLAARMHACRPRAKYCRPICSRAPPAAGVHGAEDELESRLPGLPPTLKLEIEIYNKKEFCLKLSMIKNLSASQASPPSARALAHAAPDAPTGRSRPATYIHPHPPVTGAARRHRSSRPRAIR